MMGTKRGLKRKDLINRVKMLEYALSNSIDRQRNCELVLDFYIKMNKDEKKFQKFLDKQKEDGEHKQEKRKRS
jgi:hypothetical protein|tara:strand:- start:206 stop:424 length:219 start_codon:yes stop_codon:yes gene_type:complete